MLSHVSSPLQSLRSAIDDINAWIYPTINNGVYRCGFATSQEAYDDAVRVLFVHLERVEEILQRQRYLVGNQLTEADVSVHIHTMEDMFT